MSDILSEREALIFYAEQRGYARAMEAERKLHEARIQAQAAEIERLLAALQWCSGSADFNEGGIAREGWLTLCAPLLTGGKNG